MKKTTDKPRKETTQLDCPTFEELERCSGIQVESTSWAVHIFRKHKVTDAWAEKVAKGERSSGLVSDCRLGGGPGCLWFP